MRTATLALVLFAACKTAAPTGGDDDGDDTGDPAPDAAVALADAADPAPDAAPDPGDAVAWFTWPDQQTTQNPGWGEELTDIHDHLPASYGDTYWFDDAITAAHETTHGIQAHLRNYETPTYDYNAFYVGDDRAAFVLEPDIRKSDIVPYVAQVLRGPRFQLYLLEQEAWDDTPLYVFDEWNAYVNGAEIGIRQVEDGLYDDGWTDAVMGPLEFCVYAIATAMAVAEGDPDYFASNTQFRAFTAWELRRAMELYAEGSALDDFEWQEQEDYAAAMRTSPAGEPLRAFARTTWGEAWTQEVLGF